MPCITRYQELRYEHRGDHWRILDVNGGLPGSGVGPLYKTKAELLADLDRYAREFGCDGALPDLRVKPKNARIVIDVSGGVVQAVYAPPGLDVVLIDRDSMAEQDGPVIYPNATLDQMDDETQELVREAYRQDDGK